MFSDMEAMFNQMTPLYFTKVRNVKSPTRGTERSAGIDFYVPEFDERFVSDLKSKNGPIIFEYDGEKPIPDIALYPRKRILIPSGIHVKIHHKFALIGHNKSGVASKKGLDILANVVDEDYQGEIHLNVVNTGDDIVYIIPNEKLVQFILTPVLYAKLQEVDTLEGLYPQQTERGAGGFGSTGV